MDHVYYYLALGTGMFIVDLTVDNILMRKQYERTKLQMHLLRNIQLECLLEKLTVENTLLLQAGVFSAGYRSIADYFTSLQKVTYVR